MSEYYIHEEGDPEIGFTWDLFKREDDRVVRVGTFYGEPLATRFLSAIQWYETMEQGSLSIPTEKKAKPLKVIFTPAKKKKAPK